MSYVILVVSLIIAAILVNSGEAILEILRDELKRYKTVNSLFEELGLFLNRMLGKGFSLVVIGSFILLIPATIFLIIFLVKAFMLD